MANAFVCELSKNEVDNIFLNFFLKFNNLFLNFEKNLIKK